MTRTFSSLGVRNYRIYASGAIISNVGTWMQRVAQDLLVLHLAGANGGVAVGITTGLQFGPMLVFGLWGGVLSDRFPKRRLLVVTQAALGLVALALGLLDVAGVVRVWHIYLLALLLGMVTAVDNPARQSFVVELVGRDQLTNAVGLNSASFNAARLIGPGLAGLLIGAMGTGPLFLINAATYGATIFALWRLDPHQLRPSTRLGRAKGQLREGLHYVAGRPDLVVILFVVGTIGAFGLNFQMTTALMATKVYDAGPVGYGLLGSIMGIGSLTGALLAARRGTPRLRLLLGSAALFGGLEIVAGLMPTFVTFAVILVPVGISALTFITAANSTMQLSVPAAMRGRVMALYMMLFMGGTLFGAPSIGALADALGARWGLLGGGIVSLAATLVGVAIVSRTQHVSVRARLRPRPRLIVLQQQQLTDTVQQA